MDSNINNRNIDSSLSGNYDTTLSWLFSQLPMFSRVGAAAYKPGLDTALRLDEYFGHPHRKFKSIHVAGTNGKGSTSHTLASVLQAQGYKVGLYTSPHLADFRERMRINGEMIPHKEVIRFVQDFRSTGYEGHPSFFELTMMMAFSWFARENIDYAIIEVGMGGRLDSTNIITPAVCVITNISPDHIQFLGNTLEAIAQEKAGIIKPGIPVVIGEAEGSVREVFLKKAQDAKSTITFASESPLLNTAEESPEYGWICSTEEYGDFYFPLGGDYQRHNINTALHAVKAMKDAGIEIFNESVRRGFSEVVSRTHLAGRWQILSRKPLVICDTGHNIAGLTHNFRQLARIMLSRPEATLHIVIGFVNDKDVAHIAPLFPKNATYYFTQSSVPRALPVNNLVNLMTTHGYKGSSFPTVSEAVSAARSAAADFDVVFIGGSTFIVADYLASII